jgi:homoserine O-succinyltransferase/O-acetyltransferase
MRATALDIAFVNNMPDQALAATQAQFHRLLAVGATKPKLRVRNYFLPSVTRSDTARRFLAQSYEEIGALYAHGADAIVVTGAEPRAATLEDEPYWGEFATLVDWARDHTLSALWSCLAAHAAVWRLDGVARQRQLQKISGVYEFAATPEDWTSRGVAARRHTPHSRYNAVPRAALEAKGYTVAAAGEIGVDLFWRREPSLFVFMQGHPEYDAETLSREYRRDMLRYFNGERAYLPAPPENYFAPETRVALAQLSHVGPSARSKITARLSEILAGAEPCCVWRADAERLYRNWLDEVAAAKSAHRKRA